MAAAPGAVETGEIYNLRLPVELVVWSGCQTAIGKEIRGEGLVGLTRGFMYAGAPRVVGLWKIDDAMTADMMKHSYEAMLGPQRLAPAAAPRQAQKRMWQQKDRTVLLGRVRHAGRVALRDIGRRTN